MSETAARDVRKSTIDAVTKRVIEFFLSDRFFALLIAFGSTAGAAVWAVLASHVTVPGWSVAIVVVVVVALALLAVRQNFSLRRATETIETTRRAQDRPKRNSFTPIVVHDPKLAIDWYIVTDPENWVRNHREITGSGYPHHETLLAGPYHSKPGCAAELKAFTVMRGSSPQLLCNGPSCGDMVFRVPYEETEVELWQVRAQALEELQRLARVGKAIAGEVTLENPLYWNEVLEV